MAPLQMLPPPTTTAISVPRSWRTSTISRAIRSTTLPSMVSSAESLANASPDSLRTALRHWPRPAGRGVSPAALRSPMEMPAPSAADDDLGEAHHPGAAEELRHRPLVVPGVGLLEQHAPRYALVPAVELALYDLGQGRL